MRPGVLVNGSAGRIRREPNLTDRLCALVAPGLGRVTKTVEEAETALRELAAAGVDSLAIAGGDGTVTGTLTPLLRVWPAERRPRVALLPGGSVNTIPRSFTGGGSPELILERLLQREGDPNEETRTVLEIQAEGTPPRYGMIFGNGMTTRWLDLYHEQPRRGVVGASAVVARSLASMLVNGPLARRLFERFEASVEIDGKVADQTHFSGMAAGALPQIGLGFRPFFLAGREPHRMHWILTDIGPWQLAAELPVAGLGIRAPGSALRDTAAARVRVSTAEPQPYTVDGDVFPAVSRVEVAAGPALRFWVDRPRAAAAG